MFFVSVAILLITYTALTREGRLVGTMPERLQHALQRPLTAPLCVIALTVLHIAFLASIRQASRDQIPFEQWFSQMPIAIVDDRDGRFHIPDSYGARFTLLAALESVAMFALYWSLDSSGKIGRRFVVAGAAIMWGTAFVSPAATSADFYSYVGYTLFFGQSYVPPQVPFGGEFRIINFWWGTSLPPAPYGPLWFALSAALCAPLPTLVGKIFALRCLDVVMLVSVVAALAGRGLPKRVLVLISLNPALLFYFIVNVHNDLVAVLAILIAIVLARRSIIAAIVAAICAGLIKLPYVVIAAIVLVPVRSLRTRIAAYIAIVAATLAVSWLAGGTAYLNALQAHASAYGGTHFLDLLLNPLMLPKLLAFLCLGLALAAGTFVEGGAWMLPCLSATIFPWYLAAGIPYASYDERTLRNFLVALPLATLATDTAIGNGAPIVAIALTASLILIVGIMLRVRALRDPAQRPLWWHATGSAAPRR